MLSKNYKPKALLFRESSFAVAELIFNNPSRTFHLRMIEKETGLSTTAISRAISELEGERIIKVEDNPVTKNIRAYLDSDKYRYYKMAFNIYRLSTWGLIPILRATFQNPKAIVCFGSFAKGEDLEDSDVDLLVISNKKADLNLKNWEHWLKRKINLTVLESVESAQDEFKNAVANGIVLEGYLKIE